ncbi:MAG: hypothetical protein ABIJ45_14995, partial [Candidatus Zixiibacteriota bacterium]
MKAKILLIFISIILILVSCETAPKKPSILIRLSLAYYPCSGGDYSEVYEANEGNYIPMIKKGGRFESELIKLVEIENDSTAKIIIDTTRLGFYGFDIAYIPELDSLLPSDDAFYNNLDTFKLSYNYICFSERHIIDGNSLICIKI